MAKKVTENEVAEVVQETPQPSVREQAWKEFLDAARAQRRDPAVFDMQMERGEFKTIPEDFRTDLK